MVRTENTYLVSPPYVADRLKDDNGIQDGIVGKWVFRPKAPHLHNNLVMNGFFFDTEKKTFKFGTRKDWLNGANISPSRVISSSLALYRLLCLFKKSPVISKEAYKTLWEYPLQHKETKEYLTLLEYKAGFTINSKYTKPESLPESFAFDLLELLNFLVSDQIAHPYDGTLAGTVA